MNNLENIKAKIISEAEDYKNETLKNAALQKEEILMNFKSEGDFSAAKIISDAESVIAEKNNRFLSTVKNEERNASLSVKARLISECFDEAVSKINSLSTEDYMSFLSYLLKNSLENGEAEIILNERDKTEIGMALIDKASELINELGLNGSAALSKKSAKISGGFILKYGDIEINCSTENTVNQYKKKLEGQVLDLILN